MTDKELLELAAKAAGIEGEYYCGILNDEWVEGIIYYRTDGQQLVWNPLTDDGDALRLAMKLGGELRINLDEQWATFSLDIGTDKGWFVSDNDPYAATRRAIVRAAAEIGKEMK